MQPIYKPRVKSETDRLLFLGVFIVGATGSIVLKSLFAAPIIPLAFAVVTQVIYAVCVWIVPRFRLREDRAGDSFYYLGLLFTLVSLGHTLWSFGRTADIDSGTAQVISGFGLALATTIVGLVLRVMAQQFRSDPVEIEIESRNSLVDAAGKLTGELYAVIGEMGTFRVSMKQVTEEGVRDAVKSASDGMKTIAEKFSSEVESVIGKLDALLETIGESAKQVTKTSNTTASALAKLANQIDGDQMTKSLTAIQSFSQGLAALGGTMDTVPRKLDEGLQALAQAYASAAEEVARQARALNQSATRHIEHIDSHLAITEKASSKLVGEVVRMADSIADRLA